MIVIVGLILDNGFEGGHILVEEASYSAGIFRAVGSGHGHFMDDIDDILRRVSHVFR